LPLYEYKCLKCGRLTEKIESVDGPHLKKCPHCGGKVESLLSAPAIQFKGSGWYVTDYAGKSRASDGSKEEKPAESKEASAKESPKESPAKDKKPEKAAKKK
jgi:putative FmdB family regulatory protein